MRKFQIRLIFAGLLVGALGVIGCGDGDDGSFGAAEIPSVSLQGSPTVRLNIPATDTQMKGQREVIFNNSGEIDLKVESIEWIARPERLVAYQGYEEGVQCIYDATAAPTYDSSGQCGAESVCWPNNRECRKTGLPAEAFVLGRGESYSIRTFILPGGTSIKCPEAPADREVPNNYCGELLVKTNANTTTLPDIEDGAFRVFFTHVEGRGTLQVDPPSISFSGVAPGESASRDVTLSNLHASETLSITSIRLREHRQMFSVATTPSLPTEIEPGSSKTWTLTFNPPANWDGEDLGTNLEIDTSQNPAQPKLIPVDVTSKRDLPAIKLDPQVLRFDTETTQVLTVSNEGAANLVLSSFSVTPAGASGYYTVEPVDSSTPDVVQPGGSKQFNVTFSYPSEDPPGGIGSLEVLYNYFITGEGSQNDSARVTLLGNVGDAPVGLAAPAALEFRAAQGETATRTFAIRNLGTQALEISATELNASVGTAETFTTTLSAGTTIAPGQMQAFDVTYTGDDDQADRASLRLTSNSAGEEIFLSLVAVPGEASGAEAVITPGFGDDSVPVGTQADFSALLSTGYAEANLNSAQWTLLERPAESAVFIDKLGSSATFIPDVAGSYKISLLVSDGHNTSQAVYEFSAQ